MEDDTLRQINNPHFSDIVCDAKINRDLFNYQLRHNCMSLGKTKNKLNNLDLKNVNIVSNRKINKNEITNYFEEDLSPSYITLADKKLKKMNFLKIMKEISTYKIECIKHGNRLMFKSVDNFKPYKILTQNQFYDNYKKTQKNRIFIRKNKTVKDNINKDNEKLLNFSNKIIQPCVQKINKFESESIKEQRIKKIIKIQKCIRGFLCRKNVNKNISQIMILKIIKNVVKIQRYYRSFISKKKFLEKTVINKIINSRFKNSRVIVHSFKHYHNKNIDKKEILIKSILRQRNSAIKKIQKKVRQFLRNIKKQKNNISKNKNVLYAYSDKCSSSTHKGRTNSNYNMYEEYNCNVNDIFYYEKKINEINNSLTSETKSKGNTSSKRTYKKPISIDSFSSISSKNNSKKEGSNIILSPIMKTNKLNYNDYNTEELNLIKYLYNNIINNCLKPNEKNLYYGLNMNNDKNFYK